MMAGRPTLIVLMAHARYLSRPAWHSGWPAVHFVSPGHHVRPEWNLPSTFKVRACPTKHCNTILSRAIYTTKVVVVMVMVNHPEQPQLQLFFNSHLFLCKSLWLFLMLVSVFESQSITTLKRIVSV